MARPSLNPDRNFSAGYTRDPEIDRLINEPAPLWDDVVDDPVFRERVGKLISDAIRRYTKTDFY
jgi:hypothetical protein